MSRYLRSRNFRQWSPKDDNEPTHAYCYKCGQEGRLGYEPADPEVGIPEGYLYTECCDSTEFEVNGYFCRYCDHPCTGAQSERYSQCFACVWGWHCADCGAYHRDGDHGDEDESPCFACAVKRGVAHG